MLELTLMMLIACAIFFVLHIIFASDELNVMSVLMSVVALACVLKDTEIGDDLILFVVPLFYVILMSACSLVPGWRRGKE